MEYIILFIVLQSKNSKNDLKKNTSNVDDSDNQIKLRPKVYVKFW